MSRHAKIKLPRFAIVAFDNSSTPTWNTRNTFHETSRNWTPVHWIFDFRCYEPRMRTTARSTLRAWCFDTRNCVLTWKEAKPYWLIDEEKEKSSFDSTYSSVVIFPAVDCNKFLRRVCVFFFRRAKKRKQRSLYFAQQSIKYRGHRVCAALGEGWKAEKYIFKHKILTSGISYMWNTIYFSICRHFSQSVEFH